MPRTLTALAAALLFALTLAACGGDGAERPRVTPAGPSRIITATPSATATAPPPATARATPSPTATPTATPSPTPTAAATPSPTAGAGDGAEDAPPLPASIRELVNEIAEVRGLEAPPAMRMLTVARRDVEDTYLGLVTEEERAELDETTALYRLLGYLGADEHLWDITLSFLDAVLGFYSPAEKTLWVVTDEADVGLEELGRRQRETLVHEIIHAFQDYHFDLEATGDAIGDGLDADLAFTAVIEGDAVVHTTRHLLGFAAIPAAGGVYFLGTAHQLAVIPPAILRELYFPYITGEVWARAVLDNGGVEALNGYLVEPPPATTLILHPELLDSGWAPERIGDGALPEAQLREALGEGWRVRSSGSLGEFHLMNYLLGDAPVRMGISITRGGRQAEAAEGWAGDRYVLFERAETDEAALVVLVRFAGEEDAREFEAAHGEALAGGDVTADGPYTFVTRADGHVVARVAPAGRDALFAIATSAGAARAALAPLLGG